MKSYRDLDIYKDGYSLAIDIHEMSLSLPKFELFEEGSQVRRSSKAICGAIVEGYGRRRYKAEFVRYLVMAHAECDETLLHLNLLFDTKSLTDIAGYEKLKTACEALGSRINAFIQWVEKNWKVG